MEETPTDTIDTINCEKSKISMKRKAGELNDVESECEERKRCKAEASPSQSASLLVFSDDILLMIISNLNHRSILNLGRTCERLNRICQDHTLWREVDFGHHAVSHDELKEVLKYVGDETKSICARGPEEVQPDKVVLTVGWLTILGNNCHNLTHLAVPSHCIDCRFINIHQFPRTLKCLDLSASYLHHAPSSRSYFKDISIVMPYLEILILSNCKWFEPHSLMALSKCPKLVELRLDGCTKVKDCVAYCGLATRGGFKSLQTLDLRKCPIGSSELICFASVTSIVNMYLENPCLDDQFPNIIIDAPIMILFTNESTIEIRADGNRGRVRNPRLKIQKLVVRNYKQMTDASLSQLARDAVFLQYLDVTGSGITDEGIERFRSVRPTVTLVNDTCEE